MKIISIYFKILQVFINDFILISRKFCVIMNKIIKIGESTMKKLLSLALSLALVFSVAAVAGVSASAEGETVILDWSKFNGYSGGGFDFTKDDPTGYVHVTGDKKIGDTTSVADLLNWWGWTAEGYDKIQFTAYTASGSCNIRMVFDGVEHATKTISEVPTVVTYDVPATTKTGDVKFQLDAGTKGATVSVNLYIGDVYGIKTN